MASYQGISDPALKWNGDALAIIPNSLTYKIGKGEKTVRAISAGGSAVETVHTTNVETKKGMVKFSLPNTPKAARIVAQMQDLAGQNRFEIAEGSYQATFRSMTVTNEPERPTAPDGVYEIECEGPPGTEGSNG